MVFVLDKNKTPVMPCSEKKARKLLEKGKAVIHRIYPMVIRLKESKDYKVKGLRLKLDPGSKTTGFAVLHEKSKIEADAILLGEIIHKTSISDSLEKRRMMRRGRRNRNTRYRPARWLNRRASRKKGLAPSLESRLDQTVHAVEKLMKWLPIAAISVEHVKFDMQLMQNADVKGKGYQQGTLAGYEIREYLLEKYGRKCAYCGAENIPLEIEHIHPKSKGGTNRIDNLAIACNKCNMDKGNKMPKVWLEELCTSKKKSDKERAKNFEKAMRTSKKTLKDAAMVNSTRWRLFEKMKELTPLVECGSGALTKMNRIAHKLPKEHFYDACCVGKSTPEIINIKTSYIEEWKAMGRGKRVMMKSNKFGFPTGHTHFLPRKKDGSPVGHKKRSKGKYQTGDILKGTIRKGKPNEETVTGRAVKSGGGFYFKLPDKKTFSFTEKNCTLIQHGDGWQYSKRPIEEKLDKVVVEHKETIEFYGKGSQLKLF